MSRVSVQLLVGARFPRVSGDEPTMKELADEEARFSPRERG